MERILFYFCLLSALQPRISHATHYPEWSWKEKLCINFNLDRLANDVQGHEALCALVHASSKNASEAAAFGIASICSQYSASNPSVSRCCQSETCFGNAIPWLAKRVKYGSKTVDPELELRRRYEKGDLFSAALDYQAQQHGGSPMVLLQVGANVGRQDHDPCFAHIVSGKHDIYSILFEPLPEQFIELEKNYNQSYGKMYRKPVLIRKAVCSEDSFGQSVTFVYSQPPMRLPDEHDERWKARKHDYFYRTHHSQMGRLEAAMHANGSSTNEADFESDDWLSGTSSSDPAIPVETTVTCTTIQGEIQNIDGLPHDRIDVVVVDAEGSDFVVLQSVFQHVEDVHASEKENYPGMVLFEHTGLNNSGKQDSLKFLDERGYICEMYGMMDIICIHELLYASLPSTRFKTRDRAIARPKVSSSVEILVDGRTQTLSIPKELRWINSGVSACISHSLQVNDCSRLIESVMDIINL